jgi:RarD protein
MKDKTALLKIRFVLLMALFGLIGPLVRAIGLPSSVTACLRAWISAAALVAFCLVSRRPVDREETKRTLLPMLASGALIGFNWIGLFEAYRYTTVATATVCYYVVPILILLASPLLLGERFTLRHLLCALAAFVGMIFVSGVAESGFAAADVRGPLFALLGAAGYACVILINKKFPSGDSILRTTVQLSAAAVVTTPYVLLTQSGGVSLDLKSALLLLLLGVGFTAIPYILYFNLIVRIPARSVAIFSYADPLVAVLLSVFALGEPMTLYGLIGTVLIIGAAMISELWEPAKTKTDAS